MGADAGNKAQSDNILLEAWEDLLSSYLTNRSVNITSGVIQVIWRCIRT